MSTRAIFGLMGAVAIAIGLYGLASNVGLCGTILDAMFSDSRTSSDYLDPCAEALSARGKWAWSFVVIGGILSLSPLLGSRSEIRGSRSMHKGIEIIDVTGNSDEASQTPLRDEPPGAPTSNNLNRQKKRSLGIRRPQEPPPDTTK